jgi:hypothetical protein
MAKTKSYKKVNGHWRKRRASLGAQVYGTVQNSNCAGNQYMESAYKQRRRKKVKSFSPSSVAIKAFSGDVKSLHYSGQCCNYQAILTF